MTLVDKLEIAANSLVTMGRREQAVDVRAAIDRIKSADPWARFGDIVFERFWSDGQPGDLEGGDLQDIARDCGLLGRTAEVDAGATHAEGCGWEPGMPLESCDCWAPMLGPYSALVREQEGGMVEHYPVQQLPDANRRGDA